MDEPAVSEAARSFDRVADEYERARPDYPPAVLDLVPLPPGAVVLDLAAGTGKLTRVLAARYGKVIAVEPLDNMRAVLERVVPGVESHAGAAEAIPLPDAAVDGVFVAQAFHWFATDEAVGEIARVLRPGGVLCLIWNGPDESRPSPLPRAYLDCLEELHAEAEFRRSPPPPFEDVIGRGPFEEVHAGGVTHDHVLDRTGLLDSARSVSWVATRPDDEREAVLRRLGELLPEGTYAIPNRANVLFARRRPGAR